MNYKAFLRSTVRNEFAEESSHSLGGLDHPFFFENRYKVLKVGEALRTYPIIQFQTFSI